MSKERKDQAANKLLLNRVSNSVYFGKNEEANDTVKENNKSNAIEVSMS